MNKVSLYEQLGGESSLTAVVDAFYEKVTNDSELEHFFREVNMKRQRLHMKNFLTEVLGGPKNSRDVDMKAAHSHLDIYEADFNRVAGHLLSTLQQFKVKEEQIGEVMGAVGGFKDAIVNRK